MRHIVARLGLSVLSVLGVVSAVPNIAHSQASVRCTARATAPWVGGPAPRLRLEAFSDGPTCAKAIAVFAVRDSVGKVVFSQSHTSEFLATTSQARTPTQMRAALGAWLGAGDRRFNHATLPNWLVGADRPVEQEFPFMPDPSITRADYLAIKSSRAPVLCYVQGMESLNCLVYRNGGLEPFGIQSFPG